MGGSFCYVHMTSALGQSKCGALWTCNIKSAFHIRNKSIPLDSSQAESAAKAASKTAPPPSAPQPESVKQPEPVNKPDPVKIPKPRAKTPTKTAPPPEPAVASESPPQQANTPRAKATRAKTTRVQKSVMDADAPRRFISGPEGVVAIMEKPTAQKKTAKPTPAPKPVRAKKAEPKPKVARRRAVTAEKAGESERGDDKILKDGGAAEEGLGVSGASAEGSEGARIRAEASISSGGSNNGANGKLKENGAANGATRNGASTQFAVEEPTLATAALPRAVFSEESWVMGESAGEGGGTSTSVAVEPETVEMRSSRSDATNSEVSVVGNGHLSSAEAGVPTGSGSMREKSKEANGETDKQVERATVAEQNPSPASASEKPPKTESVQNGKAAEKRADREPPGKNKYAAKKAETKKDPKEKLAGIRGGLVDRIVASPKVSTVLAAGGSGLDTPSMVRLLKDLSVKETAVKKPGLTAKVNTPFSFLTSFY